MEVRSTVTITPLTGKSTRSGNHSGPGGFPGDLLEAKAAGSIRSRSRQTYAGSAFNHHFEIRGRPAPPSSTVSADLAKSRASGKNGCAGTEAPQL